jgi:hypothetical protein
MLALWEAGRGTSVHRRALLLLEAALPGCDAAELVRLPVGLRDATISKLRARTGGSTISGTAVCPACQDRSEVYFDLDRIDASIADGRTYSIEVENHEIRFRLPNTVDLEFAALACDLDSARAVLVESCIEGSNPAHVVARVEARMAELDARADVQLALKCPECAHRWSVVFDIVTLFWREIERRARRLLFDVHELALAYGWSEKEVLGLSAARRETYLEMVRS